MAFSVILSHMHTIVSDSEIRGKKSRLHGEITAETFSYIDCIIYELFTGNHERACEVRDHRFLWVKWGELKKCGLQTVRHKIIRGTSYHFFEFDLKRLRKKRRKGG